MNTAQTPQDTPPTPTYDPFDRQRSLRRGDGPLAGVAGGLADYLNIDAALARFGFVVAGIVAGPVALVGYAAAWAVMPSADGGPAAVDQIMGRDAHTRSAA